ncbi:biotin synthase BioB, partial [Streptomyces sp. SID5770]|nr:biotin synthase BioB [Streptomyces sp. SID5770]
GSHSGGGCGPCGGHAPVPEPAATPAAEATPGGARTDLVAVRRRGAGTDLAPNA